MFNSYKKFYKSIYNTKQDTQPQKIDSKNEISSTAINQKKVNFDEVYPTSIPTIEESKPNNVGKMTFNRQNLKIDTSNYLYHSVNGFDLFKLTSILANGVCSKALADAKGIKIASYGLAENGMDNVSVSTNQALSRGCYAGDNLSLVIDSSNLCIARHFIRNCPIERQIKDQISPKHIVGIMIPDNYLTSDLENIEVFPVYSEKMLTINMNNLNTFTNRQFNSQILSDPLVKKYHDEVNALFLAVRDISYYDYDRKRKELSKKLNSSIMHFLVNQYKQKINKSNITVIDMINYHTKNKVQIYKLSGECINPFINMNVYNNQHYSFLKFKNVSVYIFEPNKSNTQEGISSVKNKLD